MVRTSLTIGRPARVVGSRRRAGRIWVASAAAAAAAGLAGRAVPTAHAAVYVYDPGMVASGSDGPGNFDGTTGDFFNTANGMVGTFGNTTGDTAVFGSGGTVGSGIVTVGAGGVSVGTIDFNQVSGNYLLTGGTINLGSASPVVSGTITTVAGVAPTIASTINGVNAVFNAPGTLTLTGANTFANATGSNIAASVATGTVVMGGSGVTETFNGELAVGSGTSPAGSAGSPNVATLNINSGTTASSNNNVGLGNTDNNGSATAYQSLFLNVNGTLKSTALFFTEYQTAQNTTATINVNSGGNISAGSFGFGQSAGTTTALNVAAGGTVVATGTGLQFGQAAGTNTSLNNAGTVTSNYTIYSNQNSNTSTGVTTLTNSGTLSVTGGFNFRLGGTTTVANTGTLSVAGNIFMYGPTTLTNSGTLTAGNLYFGYAGGPAGGSLTMSGGTLTLAGFQNHGSDFNSDGANGGTVGTGSTTVNLTGGTLTNPYYFFLTDGVGQTTVFTQTGGALNNFSTSTTDGLFFNNGASTYNLAGGIFRTNNVATQGGTTTTGSTFIFNGGTLQAQIQSTVGNGFFSPPAASVGPNGGTIDTQGFSLRSTTPITSLGGADGGITKIGTGTLAMTSANTYVGPTNVSGGTLALTGTGSINGSSRINVNGAGTKLLQLSSVTSTPPITVTNGAIDGTGTLGAVTVGNGTGGMVDNGNGSSGTLTVSSLAFLGGANANLFVSSANLAANNVAPINVLGTLSSTSAGTVTLNFTSVVSPGSTYDLFKYNAFSGDESGNTPTDFNLGSGISGRVAGSSSLVLTSTTGPGFLELVVGSADNNIRWTGARDNTWTTSQASPTNWIYSNTSTGTQTPFFNGDNVTFDDTGTNTNPILISAGNVSPASMTFNNSTATYSITSSGGYGITGAGGLIKNGTGVLTMGTSNSYTGGNTINAGTLNIGTATALGSGGQLTLGNGTGGTVTLDNTSGAAVTLTNSSVAINSDLTFVGSSSLTLGSGAGTLNGNRTITVSANTLTIPEALSGSASLTKAGAGTLTLSAVNPFNNGNGVTVNAGTLNLGAGGSAGTVSGPLTINSGATVNATAGDALGYSVGTSVTTLTVNSGGVFNLQSGGNNGYVTNLVLTGSNVTALNATGGASGGLFNFSPGFGITTVASSAQSNISSGVVIRTSNTAVASFMPVNVALGMVPQTSFTLPSTDLLISGKITGDTNQGLVKLGGGVLTLSNTNTYSGGTNVSAGTLMLNAGGSAGAVVGPLTIGSNATVYANATNALGYNAGTSVTTLTVNSGGTFYLGNSGGDQGFLTSLNMSGGLVSALTFTSGPPDQYFNFNVNPVVNGLMAPTTSISTGAGTTGNTFNAGLQIRSGGTLPVNVAAGSSLLIEGPVIEFGGSAAINKLGAGTLTVMDQYYGGGTTSNNTYTGGTTISQGTVRLVELNDPTVPQKPANMLGTGTTTILNGGTLGGGNVNGNGSTAFTGGPVVVAAGGTITGGTSNITTGVLASTGQTWNTSGNLLTKVNSTNGATDGAASDVLIMSSLNVSSGFNVILQANTTGVKFTASNLVATPVGAQATPAAGSYVVLAVDSEGAASPFNMASVINSLTLTNNANNGVGLYAATDSVVLDSFFDGTNYDLIAEDVAAPEPTSMLLLGLIGAPLALGRRRRRPAAAVGMGPVANV